VPEETANDETANEIEHVELSESVDPCGCAPRPSAIRALDSAGSSPPLGEQPEELPATQAESDPVQSPGRAVKLVALLRPIDGGYRAQLAAGADACDPELRVVEVPDIQSALAALPEVLVAAEARWQTQPRYPGAARPSAPARPRPASAPRVPPGGSTTATSSTATRPSDPVVAAPTTQPTSDQLSLFG